MVQTHQGQHNKEKEEKKKKKQKKKEGEKKKKKKGDLIARAENRRKIRKMMKQRTHTQYQNSDMNIATHNSCYSPCCPV